MATSKTSMSSGAKRPIPSASKVDGGYRVELSGLGPDLSGRSLGKILRTTALDLDSKTIIFDCTGVDTISPSFADEAFGMLAITPKRPRIEVVNASPSIISAVRFAVRQRSAAAG